MVLMMAMTTSPDAAACHKTSCTGCSGAVVVEVAGCNGCSGSSCHGGGLFKKHGCSGGGLFSGGMFKKHGCHGTSCSGVIVETGCSGCVGTPVEVKPIEEKKEMPKKEEMKKGGVTVAPTAPAFVTVNVPADAKVTIDGNATISTSAVRIYSTPSLARGTVSYYTFTAEVVREGKVYTATEKVAVEAGARPVITLTPNVGQAFASK